MILSLVAAIGKNRELGYQNDLLWHLRADLQRFKKLTLGHHLIMGRKTFESIGGGRPLPGRTTVVISRSDQVAHPKVLMAKSLDQALNIVRERKESEVFICGGGQIYDLALERADKMYLTHVDYAERADVFFPYYQNLSWKEQVINEVPADRRNDFISKYVIYDRVRA